MRLWDLNLIFEKTAKLIDVKSIITFAIVFTYLILAMMGKVQADKLESIVLVVVSFYFGIQHQKKTGG